MKKKLISVLKYLFFLSIGVALIWWQSSKMTVIEKKQFVDSIRNAHYIYILPVFIMALLSHFSRALRWKLLIEPMGFKVSDANAFYATLAGYFGNTFVPRAGEILRCTMLTRYEKVPFPKLIGTVIVERAVDLVCFLIVILLTVIIQIEKVRTFVAEKVRAISTNSSSLWLKLLIATGILIVCYFAIRWIFKRYPNQKVILKVKEILSHLKEGLGTILHLEKRKAFIAHTIFIWVMYLLQVYVGFNTLDVTAHLGIPAALSVLTLSTLAMIISPGGLGAFPVAIQQVLLIYSIHNISFGWLMWGANTAIIIIAGLASFGLLIYQNKKKNEKNRPDPRADLHLGRDEPAGKTVAPEK